MTELWNWRIDHRVTAEEVWSALAAALARPVLPLAAADPGRLPADVVLCDVWHVTGEFPTVLDCYGVPDGLVESRVAATLARRLGRSCLLRDDTLDATRHLLVATDGTIRPVHVRVTETDDGELLHDQRLCTVTSPGCRGWSQCHRSRWAPDSVVPGLAAA